MLEAGLAIDVETAPVTSLTDIPTSSYKIQVSKYTSTMKQRKQSIPSLIKYHFFDSKAMSQQGDN